MVGKKKEDQLDKDLLIRLVEEFDGANTRLSWQMQMVVWDSLVIAYNVSIFFFHYLFVAKTLYGQA